MINKEVEKLLENYKTETEKSNFTINQVSTSINTLTDILENFDKKDTEEIKKVLNSFSKNKIIEVKNIDNLVKNEDKLFEELNKNIAKLTSIEKEYIKAKDNINNSRFQDEASKKELKDMLDNSSVKDLDIIASSINSMTAENENVVKILSSLKNDIDKDENLNILEKKKLNSEFEELLIKFQENNINAYSDIESFIDKLEKKNITVNNKSEILDISNKEIFNNIVKNIKEELNKTVSKNKNDVEKIIPNINKLIKELEIDKISYNDYIKEIQKENNLFEKNFSNFIEKDIKKLSIKENEKINELAKQFEKNSLTEKEFKDEVKNILNLNEEYSKNIENIINKINENKKNNEKIINKYIDNLNKSSEKVFENSNVFTNTISKEISNLTDNQSEQIKKLYEQFKNEEFDLNTLTKSIERITNTNINEKNIEKIVTIIDKNSTNNKLTNADKIKEEQQFKQNQQLVEKIKTSLDKLNIKENDSVVKKLSESNSFEDFGKKTGEILMDKLFGKKTFLEKSEDFLKEKFSKKDKINVKLETKGIEKEVSKINKEIKSINKENKKNSKKEISETKKLEQIENKELKKLNEIDSNTENLESNTYFDKNNKSRNRRLRKKSKLYSKLSKFMPKGLTSKIGNLASKIPGLSSVGEILDRGEILGSLGGMTESAMGMLGGAGGALASAATVALPWIAGAATIGGAAYGLYNLSIDDYSQKIMDKLEKSGAVEHNFFGNSEIKDWKQIISLPNKDLDALIRYNDWDEKDLKFMKKLKKINPEVKAFISDGLNSNMISINDDKISFTSPYEIKNLEHSKIVSDKKLLKELEDISDNKTKKEIEYIGKKPKKESDKKNNLLNQKEIKPFENNKNKKEIESIENNKDKKYDNSNSFIYNIKNSLNNISSLNPLGFLTNKFLSPNENKKDNIYDSLSETFEKIFGKSVNQQGNKKDTKISKQEEQLNQLIEKGETNPVILSQLTGMNLMDVKNKLNKNNKEDKPNLNLKKMTTKEDIKQPIIINNQNNNQNSNTNVITPNRVTDKQLIIVSSI